jgi:hypothetical protein
MPFFTALSALRSSLRFTRFRNPPMYVKVGALYVVWCCRMECLRLLLGADRPGVSSSYPGPRPCIAGVAGGRAPPAPVFSGEALPPPPPLPLPLPPLPLQPPWVPSCDSSVASPRSCRVTALTPMVRAQCLRTLTPKPSPTPPPVPLGVVGTSPLAGLLKDGKLSPTLGVLGASSTPVPAPPLKKRW